MHIAWFNGDTYVGEKAMDYGLTGTTNDWVRLTLTADIPSGANRVGVYLDLKDATGTVWFDGVQLEKGNAANRYNLLNDSDIDQGAAYWVSGSGSGATYEMSAVYLTGAYNKNAYVYQTVPVNKADVCFNVYGTASAHSVSTLHEDRAFWLELEIRYADGQGNGSTRSSAIHIRGTKRYRLPRSRGARAWWSARWRSRWCTGTTGTAWASTGPC